MNQLYILIPSVLVAIAALLGVVWLIVNNRSANSAAWGRGSIEKRQRSGNHPHRHRRYKKRNPTLGQSGGLPPIRVGHADPLHREALNAK